MCIRSGVIQHFGVSDPSHRIAGTRRVVVIEEEDEKERDQKP